MRQRDPNHEKRLNQLCSTSPQECKRQIGVRKHTDDGYAASEVPLGPGQSPSDRANPMIGLPGHVANIVPRFSVGNVRPENVSVNTYLGGKRWQNAFGAAAAELIKISGGL